MATNSLPLEMKQDMFDHLAQVVESKIQIFDRKWDGFDPQSPTELTKGLEQKLRESEEISDMINQLEVLEKEIKNG
jgi:hypothetical protein